MGMKTPYTPEWFSARAYSALRPLSEGRWDYSDSLLLYVPGSDKKYEEVQEVDTPYHKLVTVPEAAYLKEIAAQVVGELPESFEYIDLGPGTEHKEQFIFDAAREQGKTFVYKPVDISQRYLQFAHEYVSAQGIAVEPIQCSFEELAEKLVEPKTHRFVSIGLTYGNYGPAEIFALLKAISADNGTAFINTQIRERTDMKALQEIYRNVADSMVAAKLRLLGIDLEHDISEKEVTDEIKVWYTIKNSNPTLESRGIHSGDKLLVFQSIRPSLETYIKDISSTFENYKILDEGAGFVGALLISAKA